MSIGLNSVIGPVVVCRPNGKDVLWNITDEKLYWISDESEFNFFHDNHVYAPNRSGYSQNMIEESGFFKILPAYYPDDIFNKFLKDFKDEIKFLESYYGEENIEIVVAAYGYYC